jgi:hypothetical protein
VVVLNYLDVLEPSKEQARLGILGLIVFQVNAVASFQTVLMVPCYPLSANLDVGLLTAKIVLKGQPALVFMHLISAVPRKNLKGAVIGTAIPIRDSLIRAIDLLVTGH